MARRNTRWTTSAALCALLLAIPAFGLDNNFDFYPEKAQNCLTEAGKDAPCSGDDAAALNECLCSNGGNFILNAASCIGSHAPDVGADTYDIMQKACSSSGTPMSVSQADFMAAVDGDDSTSTTTTSSEEPTSTTATKTDSTDPTTATVTATSTSTNDSSKDKSDDSSSSSGLSSGATIGIAVGASVGGVAILAALGFWLFRRYRRHSEETAPMLPSHQQAGPTTFPPSEPSTGAAFSPYNDYKSTTSPAPTSVSPGPHSQTTSWVSPSPPVFAGQHQPPSMQQQGGFVPYAPAPVVAELSSDTATNSGPAVEMPGSTHYGR